ncbi:MAG: hypothetical protein U0175_27960 [Caldilineaceae bacterium]
MNTYPENQPQILATIPYRTVSQLDEREIRKTIRSYATLNWQLVKRSENLDYAEYGQFSLLQFAHSG